MTQYVTFENLIKNLNLDSTPSAQINELSLYILASKIEPTYLDEAGVNHKRDLRKNKLYAVSESLSLDTKIKLMISLSTHDYQDFHPEILQKNLLQNFGNIRNAFLQDMKEEDFFTCINSVQNLEQDLFYTLYLHYLENPGLKKALGEKIIQKMLDTNSFGVSKEFEKNIEKLVYKTVQEISSPYKLKLVFSLLKNTNIEFDKYESFLFKIRPMKKEILKYVLTNDFQHVLKEEEKMSELFKIYFNGYNLVQCSVMLEVFSNSLIKLSLDKINKSFFSNSQKPFPIKLRQEQDNMLKMMESLYLSKMVEKEEVKTKNKIKI